MNKRKKINNIKISLVLILTVLILLPTIVPFLHLLEEHKQSTCYIETSHIHEQEIDCSICDFKLNQNYQLSIQEFQLKSIYFQKKIIIKQYSFNYYHQHLSYSLRGPPELLS